MQPALPLPETSCLSDPADSENEGMRSGVRPGPGEKPASLWKGFLLCSPTGPGERGAGRCWRLQLKPSSPCICDAFLPFGQRVCACVSVTSECGLLWLGLPVKNLVA